MENYTNLGKYANSLDDDSLRQLVTDFRLSTAGANLTKELKDEWRACEKYAERRRKENWDNRKISSTGRGVQGMSKGGRQERMKLPRLAEMEVEKHFGGQWRTEDKAHDWLWDKYPQFRLIDKR